MDETLEDLDRVFLAVVETLLKSDLAGDAAADCGLEGSEA
jgi:hypothetical protein